MANIKPPEPIVPGARLTRRGYKGEADPYSTHAGQTKIVPVNGQMFRLGPNSTIDPRRQVKPNPMQELWDAIKGNFQLPRGGNIAGVRGSVVPKGWGGSNKRNPKGWA